MRQFFKIRGSSSALPSRKITAEALDQRLGLPAGWTARHTGVLTRYEASGPTEAADLARQVCVGALKDAGMSFADVDLLVDASLCIQQPIPCNGALMQEILGAEARGIPSIDVHASCLGFLAALNAVNGIFAAGGATKALIVCAETPLQGVNWKEPESACLMGDGAAAFLMESVAHAAPCSIRMETYAEGAELCEVRGGGHRLTSYNYSESQRADFQFHMDGKSVHKLASKLLPGLLTRSLAEAGRPLGDYDVVPHQASGPALEFMRRRLDIDENKFHVSIAEHGNMVAAGIPFVLDAARRKLAPGAPVMLIGTAAGYTQGVALFEL